MASTFAVTRNHLIFGLCLPLAVLLGYMLADIDDPASRVVIIVTLCFLCVPVLVRWYHPLLVVSWNMVAALAFLPGSPPLWVLMSFLGLFITVLNRSVNAEHKFAWVPALTKPLVAVTSVVLVTAFLTGGIGLRVFGTSSVGGRGYFYIFAAVAGFFALSSRAIPPNKALLYVALFFLPGLTAILSRVAGLLGNKASFLYAIFPPDFRVDEFAPDPAYDPSMERISGSVAASLGVFCWLLARHGVAGIFDLSRPWRLALLVAAIVSGMFGGFRSAILLMGVIFFILFYLERLWQTRLAIGVAMLSVVGLALLVGFSDRLPLSIQRTLSFLPIKVDSTTREMAEFSTQWRIQMWKTVLPDIPKHLLLGKGYNLSGSDLFMVQMEAYHTSAASFEGAAFAGDYHNGPLSVVIPFGAAGLIAFTWFLIAGGRFLYSMYQEGAPELRKINGFLFALFLARVLMFIFIFGSLFAELYYFTGILGLSVALNVTGRQRSYESEPATANAEAIG